MEYIATLLPFSSQVNSRPNANADVERWFRSAGEECLDQRIMVKERNLKAVQRDDVHYCKPMRLHQGLGQRCPEGIIDAGASGAIRRSYAHVDVKSSIRPDGIRLDAD